MRSRKKPQSKFRFTKLLTMLIVCHGMLMITASYILSYLNREPVSDVSTVLVTQVMAPTLTYLITNCIGNIFEKNELTFSKPIKQDENSEIVRHSPMEG